MIELIVGRICAAETHFFVCGFIRALAGSRFIRKTLVRRTMV